jgi:hypothetical protein
MANEPTKVDLEKLEAKIKELTKRSDSLEASAGEIHAAAQEVKSASLAKSRELVEINKKGAAADKEAARQRRK